MADCPISSKKVMFIIEDDMSSFNPEEVIISALDKLKSPTACISAIITH